MAGVPYSRFIRSYPKPRSGCTGKPLEHIDLIKLLDQLTQYHHSSDLPNIHLSGYLKGDNKFKISSTAELIDIFHTQKNCPTFFETSFLQFSAERYVALIFPELENISLSRKEAYRHSYADEAIIKAYDVVRTSTPQNVAINYTQHGKPIIQQADKKTSSAAAALMLISGHTNDIDLDRYIHCNLGSMELSELLDDLELSAQEIQCKNIESLAEKIDNDSPAIVTVDSGLGIPQHSVVVDYYSENRVRIRDPYHGWEIDTRGESFLESWQTTNHITQIY